MSAQSSRAVAEWTARVAVAAVFFVNVYCALSFILRPMLYVSGFELSGVPGRAMVQGLGILFLMWNATYPPVIWRPSANLVLFGVVLAQQTIGLVGEGLLWLNLPPGHPALASTGLRFIVFDGIGLVAMTIGYVAVMAARRLPAKAAA